ncbi:hypothetical protein Aph02nite_59810 [Actinoplanes philippinensis]|uniref:Neocarzinostatin family protein n=1 Tax=Actinoplanes philippinensis TaxID=35752 RepID=A0A1I2JDN4_9ACTN|nr:hypothetical protein [Actinoplanes philippinensis]GIE80031.1 hypothetical protein Aph02nite_59810 [Actinoplanes philippinensis]SFF52945.1 hypothetical protein SAMN05421541_112191 [Actinoplanes philippinensis]
MSLSRHFRRVLTAAVVMTATAVTTAAPAFAAAVIPLSWTASYAGAQAGGTATYTQDPFGITRTTTVKGVIKTGSGSGCFHAVIDAQGTSWTSPATCSGETAQSFLTTFQAVSIGRVPTVRLCSAAGTSACGTAVPLW